MGLLDNTLGTVGNVVGGVISGGTTTGGSASGSVSAGGSLSGGSLLGGTGGGSSSGGVLDGVLGSGTLDGLVDADLLDQDALLEIGILPDQMSNGLLELSLLDQNGDGLVDVGLLDDNLGLSLLDQDGNGLIDLDVLDTIDLELDSDGGLELDTDGDLNNDGIPDIDTDAGSFDVVLMGTAGDDRFIIDLDQSTYVQGMGGTDWASFAASAEGFTYAADVNGVFLSNGDALHYFENVERISFSDGTLHLDTNIGETGGYAYRIYQAAFERTPDAEGLAYWIDVLDSGQKGMVEVANDFLFSQEFQQTYGALSTEDFVEELYENILQRVGETDGLDYWVDQLESGARSRADVLSNFADSQENVELVGATIETGFFLSA